MNVALDQCRGNHGFLEPPVVFALLREPPRHLRNAVLSRDIARPPNASPPCVTCLATFVLPCRVEGLRLPLRIDAIPGGDMRAAVVDLDGSGPFGCTVSSKPNAGYAHVCGRRRVTDLDCLAGCRSVFQSELRPLRSNPQRGPHRPSMARRRMPLPRWLWEAIFTDSRPAVRGCTGRTTREKKKKKNREQYGAHLYLNRLSDHGSDATRTPLPARPPALAEMRRGARSPSGLSRMWRARAPCRHVMGASPCRSTWG